MRILRKETAIVEVTDYVACDKCGKKILPDDFVEWQELYRIGFIGGYGSKFGDSVRISCDLCQECLFGMISDICFYETEEGWKKFKE